MSLEWSHGILGCFGDCTTCLLAFFCPCYLYGKNAESVGESCCLYALCSLIPILNFWCAINIRGRIRAQKGIDGTCLKDTICIFCFPFCTLVQAAREVKHGPGHLYMARE